MSRVGQLSSEHEQTRWYDKCSTLDPKCEASLHRFTAVIQMRDYGHGVSHNGSVEEAIIGIAQSNRKKQHALEAPTRRFERAYV